MSADDTSAAYIDWLLGAEGRYANDAADRGGETHYGLSAPFLASIGWEGKPPTERQARDIYLQHFWRGRRCNEVAPIVAWCMADAFVQHPPRAAALMIQQGLNVDLDGVIGPITIDAGKTPDVRLFWRQYRLARGRYYNDIVANDATQAKFINGWNERMHKLAEGLFDAGLFGPIPKRPGVMKSEGAKVAAAGTGLAGLVALLFTAVGIDATSITDALTNIGLPSAIVGAVGALLAKMRFKGS